MSSRSFPRIFAPLALVGALFFWFVGARAFSEGSQIRDAILYTAMFLLAGGVGLRAWAFAQATGDARRAEGMLLAGYAEIALAFGLWTWAAMGGVEPDSRAEVIVSIAWPAILVVAFIAVLFMELAYAFMPLDEAIELRRIRNAGYSGMSLALSMVFLFAINYVATQRDVRRDLSYFKTARPSEDTLQLTKRLGEPMRIVLFYPRVNEVLEQVRPFFAEVREASRGKVRVEVRDHALAPQLTSRHRIRDNGFVLLLRGEGESQQGESFEVGRDLEGARSRLRTLDGRFQQSFNKLTRPARSLHSTAGHGERTMSGREGTSREEMTRGVDEILRRFNIEPRSLGVAQGLAREIPSDARAVAVVGPREPFLPEEAQALLRYVRNGGRLMVMIDPDVDHGLNPLLEGLGIELLPGVLASERDFIARTRSEADRANVFSNAYSSHPTVTSATRNQDDVATVFVRGGGIRRRTGADPTPAPRLVFPLRARGEFWRDLDGDLTRDANEPIERDLEMIAAATFPAAGGREEGRAVVIADGDFVTDQVIRNAGNVLVYVDALRWLIGEEQIAGNISSEEDIEIQHTRDEDKLWFYATTFAVPIPLIGVAIWLAIRRLRSR
jgi:hypothetical protein